MKRIVFIRVYGIPLLLAISFLISLSSGLTPFRTFSQAVFVISVTMVALLTDKRYIQSFNISGSRLSITCTTHFLQTKAFEFELGSISDVKLSKRRSIAMIWPPYLNLKIDGEPKDFIILSKSLYNDIQRELTTINIAPQF